MSCAAFFPETLACRKLGPPALARNPLVAAREACRRIKTENNVDDMYFYQSGVIKNVSIYR
jgi:hypothetical protein